jgi:hypothetical protein
MQITKKVSIQGDFAKPGVDIKDGDTITILDEGTITSSEYGERHTFKIETDNGEKILSFNQTSLNNLVDAYGEETKKWVDKKAKVFIVKQMVSGTLRKIAYLTGENWEMTDDGKFIPSSNSDIPVIEDDEY